MRNGTEKARGRGRPREFDADEVLGCVRKVFIDKGYSGASLDDLAAASGLNRPSLYAAFGNKEALYLAALRAYGERSLAMTQAILARRAPIERRLRDFYHAAIEAYCAPPRPGGCMIIGTATAEAPMNDAIAKAARELLAAIESELERAFAEARGSGAFLTDMTATARARLAGALLHTLAIRARLGAPAADLKVLVKSSLPAICR